jgi:hypothetical protein
MTGFGVLDDVVERAPPRVEHLLMFQRFVSGLAVAELRVTEPRSARQINLRRRRNSRHRARLWLGTSSFLVGL